MVRLRYTPIAGYVHTIEAVINYGGLVDRFSLAANDPFHTDNGLPEANPLSTVPTLELADGTPLYGGPVIYEYLDGLHAKPKLFPAGDRLLTIRRQLLLADAIFDHYVRLVVEAREPAESLRQPYLERFFGKVVRGLDAFEAEVDRFPAALDIAQLRLVGALAFIEERLPAVSATVNNLIPAHRWRDGRPRLVARYERREKDPIFTTNIAPTLKRP